MESSWAEDEVDREVVRVLHPAVESIHSRKQDGSNRMYFVRFAGQSFTNCEWVQEGQLLDNDPNLRNKLRRFDTTFDNSAAELEQSNGLINHDPENTVVDRILSCSEVFMMIHPKKTSEITHKWTEGLLRVVRTLVNFRVGRVHPGHFYLNLTNRFADYPELAECIDFSIVINRIYIDNYASPERFWDDLESVYKAVDRLSMFLSEKSDVEELNEKMRQVTACLYQQWLAEVQGQALVFRAKILDSGFITRVQETRKALDDLGEETVESAKSLCALVAKRNALMKFRKVAKESPDCPFEEAVQQLRESLGLPLVADEQDVQLDEQLVAGDAQQGLCSEVDQQHPDPPSQHPSDNGAALPNGHNGPIGNEHSQPAHCDVATTADHPVETPAPPRPLLGQSLHLFRNIRSSFQSLVDSIDSVLAKSFWNNFATQVNNLSKLPRCWESLTPIDWTASVPSLSDPSETFFLVKWCNMSYADSTWERESDLADFDGKIKDYKRFTRAIDREKRGQYQLRLQAFVELNEIMGKERWTERVPQSKLNELRHRVFVFKDPKALIQYTPKTQPIFKNERMLRSYQLESLNWMIEAWTRKRNVILADEMGLGKTIQAMAFLNHLITSEHQPGPYLVIAPLSTLSHWKRVFEDWTHHNCVLYYDAKGKAGRDTCQRFEFCQTDITMKGLFLKENKIVKFSVLVTSFEVFLQDFESVFQHLPFQHIIIDEAHRLKNRHAKIIKILKRLVCQRIFLLTGTPIQNNLSELWSLLNFIEPSVFNDIDQFLSEFNSQMTVETIQKLKQALAPFLLRRMKEEVESSIPPLVETIIDVELTSVQKVVYKTIYEKNKGTLQKGLGFSGITLMNNLEMQLRKCCNHPFTIKDIVDDLTKECTTDAQYIDRLVSCSGKMIFVHKALDKFRKENKKVLIFSQFTNILSLLEEYLLFYGVRHYKIDGSTKAKDRQVCIDRFNGSQDCFEVFLLSTKAGGLGINLTSASIVIIFDSDWNPQNDIQAIARAHRIGQTQEVKVFRLISKKTYESEMFERASRKLGLDQAILLTNTGTYRGPDDDRPEEPNKLRADEIEMLLRKGMIGFLNTDNDSDEAQRQFGENIDDIIQNARVAKYSVIKGLYSFSKADFVGDSSEAVLHIDDPDFWKKAFVIQKHAVENLEKEYLGLVQGDRLRSIQVQKDFFLRFSEELCKYLNDRVTNEGFSADTEIKFCDLLIQISDNTTFDPVFRELAAKFNADFNKGARRIKKLDERKLDSMLKSGAELRAGIRPVEEDSDEGSRGGAKRRRAVSDNEDSPRKRESLNDDSQVFENEEEKLFYTYRKNRKNKTEEKAKGCDFCGGRDGLVQCEGQCKRLCHLHCLKDYAHDLTGLFGKPPLGPDSATVPDSDGEPLLFSQESQKCFFCLYQRWNCFACRAPGGLSTEEYNPLHSKENSGATASHNGKDSSSDLLFKCSICPKMYHSRCISVPPPSDDPKDRKKDDTQDEPKRFVCEQHFCSSCKVFSIGMYQCVECPFASHKKCMSKRNQTIGGFKIRCVKHLDRVEKAKKPDTKDKEGDYPKLSRRERKELSEKNRLAKAVAKEHGVKVPQSADKKPNEGVKRVKRDSAEAKPSADAKAKPPKKERAEHPKKERPDRPQKPKANKHKQPTESNAEVERSASKKRGVDKTKNRAKDRSVSGNKRREKAVEGNAKLSIEFFKPFDYSSYKKVG